MASEVESIIVSKSKSRKFFVKVNTDLEFRMQFLMDPITTLKNFGFALSPDAEIEINAMVDLLRNVPGTNQLPHGFAPALRGMGATNPPESAIIGLLIQ